MNIQKTIQKLAAGQTITIAALGDSLTYGWMVKKGYLDFLRQMLTAKYPGSIIKIINRGIPGDTAEGGLLRLHAHVIKTNPDLTLIQFALNDAFSGYPLVEFQNNIMEIVKKIKKYTLSEILLMTSSALDEREKHTVEHYYNCLKFVAEKESVPVALVHEYWEAKISGGTQFSLLVQEDRVHPTEEGYRLMAEAVMELV